MVQTQRYQVFHISYHINNIFNEGELKKEEVFRKIRITTPP